MSPILAKIAKATAILALLPSVVLPLASSGTFSRNHSDADEVGVLVRLDIPEPDVVKAVQDVTQDQIIHGTYSYEKEKILYGAHSADSARVFGTWTGQGRVFYKVADKVLAPKFFKNSGDIGTVTVRYVVVEASPSATTLQINAIFVDARGVRHPSEGNVEGSEYAAVQDHVKTIQADRRQEREAEHEVAAQRPIEEHVKPGVDTPTALPADVSDTSGTVSAQELQKQVRALRQRVELRVKDSGATLKSAPFKSATTIATLPPNSDVLIVVLTSYWFGVETVDGHHGWVHHSQLESIQ